MGPQFVKRLLSILASVYVFTTPFAVMAADEPKDLVLESIEVIAGNDKPEQVVFKFNGSHTPKSFRIEGDNPRLVFDFFGVKYASAVNRISDVGGNIIAGVRVGKHYEPPKTRVVVDIQQDSPYVSEQTFNVSNNSLTVTFSPDLEGISAIEEQPDQLPRIEVESTKIVHSLTAVQSQPDDPQSVKVEEQQTSAAQPDDSPSGEVEEQQTSAAQPDDSPSGEVEEQQTSADQTDEGQSMVETAAESTTIISPTAQPDSATVQSPDMDQETAEQDKEQTAAVAETDKVEQQLEPQQSVQAEEIGPVLLEVSFEKSINNSETVLFRLNHFYPPLVFGVEKGEPRVICHFLDARIGSAIPSSIDAGGQFIDRILVSEEPDPDKVRVELVLVPNRNYDLQQLFFKEENLFVIIVKELQDDAAKSN